MMTRYLLAVTSRSLSGREKDYRDWYENTHVGEVLALPGFLSCQIHLVVKDGAISAGEMVAHYTVETDSPAALLDSLFAAAPTMKLTDNIDPESAVFTFLKPL